MKAVVLYVEGAESVVLGDDGVVHKIKGAHTVGETIELGRIVVFPGRLVRGVAAAAAAVVLLVAGGAVGYRQYFQEASYVSLDVNPSLEYVLNRQNKVLRVDALNEDAAHIAEKLGTGGELMDTIGQTTERLFGGHYLGEGADNLILISVASDSDPGTLAGIVEHYYESSGDLTLSLRTASVEEAREARELGVSLGRYQMLCELVGGKENLTAEALETYGSMSVANLVTEHDAVLTEHSPAEPDPSAPETEPPAPTVAPAPTPTVSAPPETPAPPPESEPPAETPPVETPAPTQPVTPPAQNVPREHRHRLEPVERTEPTCTEDGMDAHFRCADCGNLFDAEGKEIERDDLILPAPGHTPGDSVRENSTRPGCTQEGSYDEVVYCSVCGEELSRRHISLSAAGHGPDKPVREEETEPTCTQDGGYDEVVYCSLCGNELSRIHVVSPAVGHVHGETVRENETEPTCTEDGGYDEVVYCSVCGEELSRTRVAIPAAGHVPGETVRENETKPTCTEDGGYDEVVCCSVCGEELSRTRVAIPAAGHVPGETVRENETKPTCTEDGGYDEVVYCSVCGEELSRTHVVIPAPGHVPGESVRENETEPTCTEDGGYDEVVYCSVCGEELSRTHVVIPHFDHEWGGPEWQWAEDLSTATATFTCAHCSETVTLTAEITVTVLREPTRNQNGETEYRAVVRFLDQTYEDVRIVETEWSEDPDPPPWWPWWPHH